MPKRLPLGSLKWAVRPFGQKASWVALILGLLVGCHASAQGSRPEPAKSVHITKVTPSRLDAPVCDRIEVAVELDRGYENPFDPDLISLDAEVTPPSGKAFVVPGYYVQGTAGWRVRLALLEQGPHKVVIVAKDKDGQARSEPITLTGLAPGNPGFVKVSARDPRYFDYQNGSAFFPLGVSSSVSGKRPELALLNTMRLVPTGSVLVTKTSGASKIDPDTATQIEAELEKNLAQQILCLEEAGELQHRGSRPKWPANPYNRDNGGPLNTPKEFWTNADAERLYRAKLRYAVARYGAYKNLLAWELWREVDTVDAYDRDAVRNWFDRQTQFLKELDPYKHLITTSFADPIGDKNIDRLPGIDFTQTHLYNLPDLVPQVVLQQAKKATYSKPHLVTEVAADRSSDRLKEDSSGLQVHDPMWASVASGAAGAAMPWWTESFASSNKMSRHFSGVAAFVKGIDWPAERFRQATPTFAFQEKPPSTFYRDLVLENGPVSWANTEYNLPRYVRIYPWGVQYGLPVAGILHGQKLHPSKFNPVTFTMDLRNPTQLDLTVGEVSGSGGAYIKVTLDGEDVLGLDLADPKGLTNQDTITKYRGTYSVSIPAGHHVLRVADVGRDWVKVGYRFRDLLPRKGPPLIGYSSVGESVVVGWVRLADRSWDRLIVQKRPVPPCPPTTFALKGLLAGSWKAELWDTWAGRIVKSINVRVGADGNLALN
ncbi:MAG: hypothetical protein QOJ65_2316, partial [Fimbriimonadaceae bacterium]|nr:hypothetical protein [Fimbriimonadaceae bacterium]